MRGVAILGFALALLCPVCMHSQVPGGRILDIKTIDVEYVAATDRLYALTAAAEGATARVLLEVDPAGPSVLRSLNLAETVDTLALSPDHTHLLAYSRQPPVTVYRIALGSFEAEANPWRPVIGSEGGQTMHMAVPLDNEARTYAASFDDGTAIFDGEKPRPKILRGRFISQIYRTEVPGVLYGYNGRTTGWEVSRLAMGPEGLEYIGDPIRDAVFGFNRAIQIFEGRMYAANGWIYNVEARQKEGMFRSYEVIFAEAFAIDADKGLMYFTTRSEAGISYFAHDLRTYLPVARLRIESTDSDRFGLQGAARRMLLTRARDLVVFDWQGSKLLFIPTESLPKIEPWKAPEKLEQIRDQVWRLRVPASYLTADRNHGKLLASLQGGVPGSGNSLLQIDPRSGKLEWQLFVGAEPGPPVATDSGKYAYVPLLGESAVRRVKVEGGELDYLIRIEKLVNSPLGRGHTQAAQVLPLPGQEDALVVVQADYPETRLPYYDGVVVYDGQTRRPKTLESTRSIPINSAAIAKNGRRLYGLNGQDSAFGFSTLDIKSDGVVLEKTTEGIGNQFLETLSCDDNLCATTLGSLVEAEGPKRAGRLPVGGTVLVDATAGLVYVLQTLSRSMVLLEFDARTQKLRRKLDIPTAGPAYDLCRWADGQFAALTQEGILIISGSALEPLIEAPIPQPVKLGQGRGMRWSLSLRAIAYDTRRQLIYGAVADSSPSMSHEIIAIDLKSRSVLKRMEIGGWPGLLSVSDDRRYLYFGQETRDRVGRIDLDKWELADSWDVPGRPVLLTLRPGDSDRYVLAMGSGPAIGFGGLSSPPAGLRYYHRGTELQTTSNNTPSWALTDGTNRLYSNQGRWRMDEERLWLEQAYSESFLGPRGRAIDSGLLFSEGGMIGDLSQMRLQDQVEEKGAVWPDVQARRVYYLRETGIRVYDLDGMRMVGMLKADLRAPSPEDSRVLFGCGDGLLATLVGSDLVVVDTADIEFLPDARSVPIDRSVAGVQRLAMRATAIAFDPLRKRLYATTPGFEGTRGQSVVSIDPDTGDIRDVMPVGVSPTSLTLSEDAATLYVGLKGSRSIAAVNLDDKKVTRRIPFPQLNPRSTVWPMGMVVMPGKKGVLGVSAHTGIGWSDWQQVILEEDGRSRPRWVGANPFQSLLGFRVHFSQDGSRFQGFDTTGANGGRWSLPVTDQGVEYRAKSNMTMAPTNVAVCGNEVITSNGEIFDRQGLEPIGTIAFPAVQYWSQPEQVVACDESRDRLYFWRRFEAIQAGRVQAFTVLDTFAVKSREHLSQKTLPNSDGHVTEMISLGEAGVAYIYGGDREPGTSTGRFDLGGIVIVRVD